ncbi:ABC transporter substrate-binding protein [Paenarthrobacter aurescens]|uniref:Carbohydrate-binding protein n=1 Tax=Paenarthrobacter aurescens TaxID=43663 RepID=A0A4Y3N863_PAEAU|nr:extracellular solute-binding protein [Paenarthrobacter aurescens]MDO6144417.1 extracellular solute-binding protein [Paenarthrobacter aurescens]MDO6148264.1 extracellular solute-binding protein [Paenarthrobacter aurescens]MDO6159508.1 extracellular solute-binding protein [Paenarthrobacter aurescens]MDO6163491.1 extracellular solute-binding protein [Paenarthrobacter aurescens]GEB17980.1 carbohydrate-binding protein [Paenarthrobacter aurescens]
MSVKLTRRKHFAAVGLGLALIAGLLSGCTGDAGSGDSGAGEPGKETIRFTFSKREAIGFMTKLVADYNASQDDTEVVLDTSGVDVVSASFVRGNPPDIALANYNMETSRFVQRGALSDLSGTAASSRIREDLKPLMDQYGSYPGRTSALPYSVMASSVIYNKEIFAANNIKVPTTWSELIAACEALKAAGVTPFYATWKDDWTIAQGWFDYSVGGQLDTLDFFRKLDAEGVNVGPESSASFQKDFDQPVQKMLTLAKGYVNKDAASRAYGDGNLAFSQGKAAMYLQGPWAFSEIAKTAPDLQLGTFPLPMTEDPDDLRVRVNVDLAAWIPEASKHKDAARGFLEYLYRPEVIDAYNKSQLGFTPTKDAANVPDPRIEGMVEYYNEAKVYQGPSVLVPRTIPIMNYTQAIVFGASPAATLRTLDADWARLAFRQ